MTMILTFLQSEPVGLITLGLAFFVVSLLVRKKLTQTQTLAANKVGKNN
jgi:hypothetical protein